LQPVLLIQNKPSFNLVAIDVSNLLMFKFKLENKIQKNIYINVSLAFYTRKGFLHKKIFFDML